MSIFARETGQSITFLPSNKQDQLSVTQNNEVSNKTAKPNTYKKKMQNLKKTKLPILRIIK
jgi:stringent starvation protein B